VAKIGTEHENAVSVLLHIQALACLKLAGLLPRVGNAESIGVSVTAWDQGAAPSRGGAVASRVTERRAWCDAPTSPHNALGFRGDIQNLHPENSIGFAVTASVDYAEGELQLEEPSRTGRRFVRPA
jgi:hypothetical protein